VLSAEISMKVFLIEHIYKPTANFCRNKMNESMYLQRYIRLVTAISRQF